MFNFETIVKRLRFWAHICVAKMLVFIQKFLVTFREHPVLDCGQLPTTIELLTNKRYFYALYLFTRNYYWLN